MTMNRWLSFPAQCLLCGMSAGRRLSLCEVCAAALPWQPVSCRRCGEVLPEASLHQGICGGCLAHPPVIDRCLSALSYEPPIDALVQRFKFHADFACGRVLATLLAQRVSGCGAAGDGVTGDGVTGADVLSAGVTGIGVAGADGSDHGIPNHVGTGDLEPDDIGGAGAGTLLVPIPLHPSRQRERGFNQARELARPLAKLTGAPLSLTALRRRRRTHSQSGAGSVPERRRNLRNAFEACRPKLVGVERVILVDDVITTMSTVLAAAASLKRAGVPQVEAWSVSRVNVTQSPWGGIRRKRILPQALQN